MQLKDAILKKSGSEESRKDTVPTVGKMSAKKFSAKKPRERVITADSAKYTKRKDDKGRQASGFSIKNTGDIWSE